MKRITKIAFALMATALLAACDNSQATNGETIIITPTEEPAATAIQATISTEPATDITKAVRDYIFNGQGNTPDANKLKWLPSFFERVDINKMYDEYKKAGGNADDVQAFATYITKNAPIPDDWKNLVKTDVEQTYGEKIVRFEETEGDSFDAYVLRDGKEVLYFSGSRRTGYYRG